MPHVGRRINTRILWEMLNYPNRLIRIQNGYGARAV